MTDASTGARTEDGTRTAWAHGLATITEDGATLDTWSPPPQLGPAPRTSSPRDVPAELGALEATDPQRGVRQVVVRTEIDLDAPPVDPADAYLRLHLLSHRLVRPPGVNLTGLFGVLGNVGWTNYGPWEASFSFFDPAATFVFPTGPFLGSRSAYEQEWDGWESS